MDNNINIYFEIPANETKTAKFTLYICRTVKTEFGEVSDGDRIKQFELTFDDSYIH